MEQLQDLHQTPGLRTLLQDRLIQQGQVQHLDRILQQCLDQAQVLHNLDSQQVVEAVVAETVQEVQAAQEVVEEDKIY